MQKVRTAVIGVGYLRRFHAQKYAALPDSLGRWTGAGCAGGEAPCPP